MPNCLKRLGFLLAALSAPFICGCVENIILEVDERDSGYREDDITPENDAGSEDDLFPVDDDDNDDALPPDDAPDGGELPILPFPDDMRDADKIKEGYTNLDPIKEGMPILPGPPPEKCQLETSQDLINFDRVTEDTISRRYFHIRNISREANCNVSLSVSLNPDFKVSSEAALPRTLPPGGKLDFTIVFEPETPGRYEGKVWIFSNSSLHPGGLITIDLIAHVDARSI